MSSPVRYLLAVLAILGLGTSQVLGIAGGYACECSGEPVMASGPDCDAGGCHDHADEAGEQAHETDSQELEDGGHTDPGNPHEHEKLTLVLLGHSFVPHTVGLPLISVCPALPGVNCTFPPLDEEMEPERTAAAPGGGDPPPLHAGVLVARTVVMLV